MNDSADQFATFANGAASYAGYRKGMADTNAAFFQASHKENKAVVTIPKMTVMP
jgi:hypothetical protein